LRLLLVVDNIDNILPRHNDIASTALKGFLYRLFDRCRFIKLFVTSAVTLRSRGVRDFGLVDASVDIGPLTLRSSLLLFAKLSPSLVTAKDKTTFINSLLPKNQADVTTKSADVSLIGMKILSMLGNGHPSRIVKLALQSTDDTIAEMRSKGEKILNDKSNSFSNPHRKATGRSSDESLSGHLHADHSVTNILPNPLMSHLNSLSSLSGDNSSPVQCRSRRPSLSLHKPIQIQPNGTTSYGFNPSQPSSISSSQLEQQLQSLQLKQQHQDGKLHSSGVFRPGHVHHPSHDNPNCASETKVNSIHVNDVVAPEIPVSKQNWDELINSWM